MTEEAQRNDWKPSEGDSITGVVKTIRENFSTYGPFKVLELETPSGPASVACFGVSLKTLAERANVGDKVALTYEGEKQASSGRMYKHYQRMLNGVEF